MKYFRAASLILLLMAVSVTLVQAAGFTCEPQFQAAQNKRLSPYTFYDQAMASIETLYPDHVILVSRRDSGIAGVNYALVAYKENADAKGVRVDGAAASHSRAWTFNLDCPADKAMDGLLTLLEQIADLKDLPEN